jgi:general secretion pathway protein J
MSSSRATCRMHDSKAGFTLLEMLVVVGVLGFLMVGLTQGVRAGLALWEAQSRRIGETSELDATARILRSLLSAVAPSQSNAPGADTAFGADFKGTADSVTFVGDLPTGLGTTRRANITIELRGGRLLLRWTPHRHELSSAPPPEAIETELIRRVDRLDLAYWGAASPGEPAGWRTHWDGVAIPELIRVRLTFAAGAGRRFPDLIAAPQP